MFFLSLEQFLQRLLRALLKVWPSTAIHLQYSFKMSLFFCCFIDHPGKFTVLPRMTLYTRHGAVAWLVNIPIVDCLLTWLYVQHRVCVLVQWKRRGRIPPKASKLCRRWAIPPKYRAQVWQLAVGNAARVFIIFVLLCCCCIFLYCFYYFYSTGTLQFTEWKHAYHVLW